MIMTSVISEVLLNDVHSYNDAHLYQRCFDYGSQRVAWKARDPSQDRHGTQRATDALQERARRVRGHLLRFLLLEPHPGAQHFAAR